MTAWTEAVMGPYVVLSSTSSSNVLALKVVELDDDIAQAIEKALVRLAIERELKLLHRSLESIKQCEDLVSSATGDPKLRAKVLSELEAMRENVLERIALLERALKKDDLDEVMELIGRPKVLMRSSRLTILEVKDPVVVNVVAYVTPKGVMYAEAYGGIPGISSARLRGYSMER